MKRFKISIIVPIYNVKDYIRECIDSILVQDYDNYELILVDDGSTDGTSEIVDEYRFNSNVKIFHNVNSGPSKARNFGIDISSGDYIMFVDSDDKLYDFQCLSKLNIYINKYKSDVIQYKFAYLYNNYLQKQKDIVDINNLNNKNECLKKLNRYGNISCAPWDKIIKSSFLKEKRILFPEGMFCEDVKWSYELYMAIDSIKVVNEDLYIYRQQRVGSTTFNKSKKTFNDLFEIVKYFLYYSYSSEEEKTLYYNMISYWYLILRTDYDKKYYSKEQILFFKEWDTKIINYNYNYKVELSYKIYRLLGYNLTLKIMKLYLLLKNKGIIRL